MFMKTLQRKKPVKSSLLSQRPIEIDENRLEYTINISMPEFTQDNVSVNVNKDMLKISVKKQMMMAENLEKVYERSFKLPTNANKDSITAKLKGGVLSVRIPKNYYNANRLNLSG